MFDLAEAGARSSTTPPTPDGRSAQGHAAAVPQGAGGRDQSTLVAVEQAVAPGWATVHADFPYRKEGRRAPDRPPKLLASVQARSWPSSTRGGSSSAGVRWVGGCVRWSRPAPTASRLRRPWLAWWRSRTRCTRQASRTRSASSTCHRSPSRACSCTGRVIRSGRRGAATVDGDDRQDRSPTTGSRAAAMPSRAPTRGSRRRSPRGCGRCPLIWARSFATVGRILRPDWSHHGSCAHGRDRFSVRHGPAGVGRPAAVPDEPADDDQQHGEDDVLEPVEGRLDLGPVVTEDVCPAPIRAEFQISDPMSV